MLIETSGKWRPIDSDRPIVLINNVITACWDITIYFVSKFIIETTKKPIERWVVIFVAAISAGRIGSYRFPYRLGRLNKLAFFRINILLFWCHLCFWDGRSDSKTVPFCNVSRIKMDYFIKLVIASFFLEFILFFFNTNIRHVSVFDMILIEAWLSLIWAMDLIRYSKQQKSFTPCQFG